MSRRIGTLTFHNANNYGAALQAYALQKYLEKLYPNDIIEVINYKCKGVRNQKSLKYYIKSQGLVSGIIHFFLALMRIQQIDRFCKDHVNTSPKVNSRDELIHIAKEYDFIISGSDQVWNRKWTGGEDTYLQDFHDSSEKKLSYAASFGMEDIPDEWRNDYQRLLRKFSGVSVREEVGKCVCENLCVEASVHVDPTLLLKREEWDLIANKKLRKEKPFVLVYMVPYQDSVYYIAKDIAKKNNLEIRVVSKSLKQLGKQYNGLSSIEKIVSMFKNADYIVTNSFHGTAFSVIFHKRFVVVLNNKWGYNIRSAQLITTCGLSGDSEKPETVECFNANWEKVEKMIEKERKRTERYFQQHLGDNEKLKCSHEA